jgi:hypothetical protein
MVNLGRWTGVLCLRGYVAGTTTAVETHAELALNVSRETQGSPDPQNETARKLATYPGSERQNHAKNTVRRDVAFPNERPLLFFINEVPPRAPESASSPRLRPSEIWAGTQGGYRSAKARMSQRVSESVWAAQRLGPRIPPNSAPARCRLAACRRSRSPSCTRITTLNQPEDGKDRKYDHATLHGSTLILVSASRNEGTSYDVIVISALSLHAAGPIGAAVTGVRPDLSTSTR